jgi:phosphopantothenoylcysteine decarboxylase/phosphopantothenate--cysteine ligase
MDILAELGRQRGSRERPLLVGFAAETSDVVARARAKRQSKRVDLMVANDVSRSDAGFESETNAVTLITADGEQVIPLQAKSGVARLILDRVESMLTGNYQNEPA